MSRRAGTARPTAPVGRRPRGGRPPKANCSTPSGYLASRCGKSEDQATRSAPTEATVWATNGSSLSTADDAVSHEVFARLHGHVGSLTRVRTTRGARRGDAATTATSRYRLRAHRHARRGWRSKTPSTMRPEQRQHHLEGMADDVGRRTTCRSGHPRTWIGPPRPSWSASVTSSSSSAENTRLVVGDDATAGPSPGSGRIITARAPSRRPRGVISSAIQHPGSCSGSDGDTQQPTVSLTAEVADPTVVRTSEGGSEIGSEVIGIRRVQREAGIQRGRVDALAIEPRRSSRRARTRAPARFAEAIDEYLAGLRRSAGLRSSTREPPKLGWPSSNGMRRP